MKWFMTIGIGVLFVTATFVVQAAEPVECENNYGSATVRDGGYSFECKQGGAGDGGGSGITVDMETCMEILESNCGSDTASCKFTGTYSSCTTARGFCYDFGSSYQCFCHDGSQTDCALIGDEIADMSCQQRIAHFCPEADLEERCAQDRGACWLYPAGYMCTCRYENSTSMSNWTNYDASLDFLDEHSCTEILEQYCSYAEEIRCTSDNAAYCQQFVNRQLDCESPIWMGELIGEAQCCDLFGIPNGQEYLDCIEQNLCNDAVENCEYILIPDASSDGDEPGDSLADGDTPDGDEASDSEEDGDDADGDAISLADGDDGEAGGDSGAADEDGGCKQTTGAGAAGLLLMLAMIARRRIAWSRR